MSQVRFYSAKFNFAKLKQLITNYPNAADFAYLIFQPVNEDSNTNRDVYNLIAYRVGSNLSVKEIISSSDLSADTDSSPYKHSGRLFLGNFPLSRGTIADYVSLPDSEIIDHLYFEPEAFPRQRSYVHYNITVVYKGEFIKSASTLAGNGQLNPSPPADPS
jgi:hypothetical protein